MLLIFCINSGSLIKLLSPPVPGPAPRGSELGVPLKIFDSASLLLLLLLQPTAFGAPSGPGRKGGAQAPAFGQAVPSQPALGATSSLGTKPTLGQAAPTQPASGATSCFGVKAGAQGALGLLAPAQPAFGAASALGSTAVSREAQAMWMVGIRVV